MMVPAAIELGIDIRVLAETEGMSAAIASTGVGDYTDLETVRAFARDVDVVTFDHEHVPQAVLRALQADGVKVHPGPDALQYAQDKLRMRERLGELGIPMPDWARVTTPAELDAFIADHGGQAVVKTARGGYDGKGVRVVQSAAQVEEWFLAINQDGVADEGGALLAEELVDFRRELAQLVARRPSGDTTIWPVVESVQQNGVCAEVIAPAPGSAGNVAEMAARIGTAIAHELDVTGVLAVELFETTDERILVNELAMRPHNTGHWTIDGSTTSQFEQHLRAVLDLPFGATGHRDPWSVMVNILGGPADGELDGPTAAAMADQPAAKVHLYGKQTRPGRKIGHITVGGEDLDDVAFRARAAAAFFQN
jgi:5-(carboxyamino)imidazole ribonucleotide synthase